ncbi:hypothetical protein TNCV_146031 [Trichonephila clavipes]|nr:hypothetical protein TNCV_146031 [Trichonephila clavipes]
MDPVVPIGVYHTSALHPHQDPSSKPLSPLHKRGRPRKTLPGPSQSESWVKKDYETIFTLVIGGVNFGNAVALKKSESKSLEKNLRTEEFAIHFFSGLIHLLKNCPANSEFLREKVLNVLSMSLKMSLKKG